LYHVEIMFWNLYALLKWSRQSSQCIYHHTVLFFMMGTFTIVNILCHMPPEFVHTVKLKHCTLWPMFPHFPIPIHVNQYSISSMNSVFHIPQLRPQSSPHCFCLTSLIMSPGFSYYFLCYYCCGMVDCDIYKSSYMML
jgi:hypothetical protein